MTATTLSPDLEEDSRLSRILPAAAALATGLLGQTQTRAAGTAPTQPAPQVATATTTQPENWTSYYSRSKGPSMWPTFSLGGEKIKVVRGRWEDLKPGQVVTYYNKMRHSWILHRVSHKNPFGQGWVTKGDNNQHADMGIMTPDSQWGFVEWVQDLNPYDYSLIQDVPDLYNRAPTRAEVDRAWKHQKQLDQLRKTGGTPTKLAQAEGVVVMTMVSQLVDTLLQDTRPTAQVLAEISARPAETNPYETGLAKVMAKSKLSRAAVEAMIRADVDSDLYTQEVLPFLEAHFPDLAVSDSQLMFADDTLLGMTTERARAKVFFGLTTEELDALGKAELEALGEETDTDSAKVFVATDDPGRLEAEQEAERVYDRALDEHPEWWEGYDQKSGNVDSWATRIFDKIIQTYGIEFDSYIGQRIYEHVLAGLT